MPVVVFKTLPKGCGADPNDITTWEGYWAYFKNAPGARIKIGKIEGGNPFTIYPSLVSNSAQMYTGSPGGSWGPFSIQGKHSAPRFNLQLDENQNDID